MERPAIQVKPQLQTATRQNLWWTYVYILQVPPVNVGTMTHIPTKVLYKGVVGQLSDIKSASPSFPHQQEKEEWTHEK